MALSTAFVVLFATVLVSARSAPVLADETSLVQTSLRTFQKEHQEPLVKSIEDDLNFANTNRSQSAPKTPCECMSWAFTYEHGLVECGRGFEFASSHEEQYEATAEEFLDKMKFEVGQRVPIMSMEHCFGGFERLRHNVCVRATADDSQAGNWYSKHWCYVADECARTKEVAAKNLVNVPKSKVHIKYCDEKDEVLLGKATGLQKPQEVYDWGRKCGIDEPGNVFKLAYPKKREFGMEDLSKYASLLEEVEENTIDSSTPVLIDLVAGKKTGVHLLVKGKRRWLVHSHGLELLPSDKTDEDVEALAKEIATNLNL